jgi:hypothetical protein
VEELKLSGKGTKVTPETFAAWQERKRKVRADAAKKLVEAELRKKKGGKGLGVLSGRALYEYKKELFTVDDIEDEGRNGDEDNNEADNTVEQLAALVESDLFLEGDDDDLDDLEED